MRQVIVFEKALKEGTRSTYINVEDGKGKAVFHAWGCSAHEFDSGYVGTFSTAIVERIDGTVENVPVEMIRFVND